MAQDTTGPGTPEGKDAAEAPTGPAPIPMSDAERDELASQLVRPSFTLGGSRRTDPAADR